MNRDRMQRLYSHIVAHRDRFNMERWQTVEGADGWERSVTHAFIQKEDTEEFCGTSACIGGWTVFLFWRELSEAERSRLVEDGLVKITDANLVAVNNFSRLSARMLGLNYDEGDELFFPSNYDEFKDHPLTLMGSTKFYSLSGEEIDQLEEDRSSKVNEAALAKLRAWAYEEES